MKNQIKCPNCEYEGKSKTFTKGSIIIELFLWLLMVLPGLIYSFWRHTSRYKGCPKCEYRNVIKQ